MGKYKKSPGVHSQDSKNIDIFIYGTLNDSLSIYEIFNKDDFEIREYIDTTYEYFTVDVVKYGKVVNVHITFKTLEPLNAWTSFILMKNFPKAKTVGFLPSIMTDITAGSGTNQYIGNVANFGIDNRGQLTCYVRNVALGNNPISVFGTYICE